MLLFLTESRGKFSDRNYRAVASHAIYKSTEQQSILDHPSSSLPASSSPPALPPHRCLRERRDSAAVKQVGRQAGSPQEHTAPRKVAPKLEESVRIRRRRTPAAPARQYMPSLPGCAFRRRCDGKQARCSHRLGNSSPLILMPEVRISKPRSNRGLRRKATGRTDGRTENNANIYIGLAPRARFARLQF